MKTVLKTFGILLMSVSLITSCNKDDNYAEPMDVVTLNMNDEANGKTRLGQSDVYINKSNNFQTSLALIADLGSQRGIGTQIEPQLGTLATEVAVIPGHLYQIFPYNSVRTFPSGVSATKVGEPYYKTYVVSQLKNNDKVVGALVQYVLTYPDSKGLLKADTKIGTIQGYGKSISIPIPNGAECIWGDDVMLMFDISTNNNTLRMTPKSNAVLKTGTYKGYIRVDNIFTTVLLNVIW